MALLLFAVAPLAAEAASFFEDFESYAAGSTLHGQGGWVGLGSGAAVSNAFAYAGAKSVEIGGGSGVSHEFSGFTGGQLEFWLRLFVPSQSEALFDIRLCYNEEGNGEGAMIHGSASDGTVVSPLSPYPHPSAPLITDRWVECRFRIDLDANSVEEYYDGWLLNTHQWYDPAKTNAADRVQSLVLYNHSWGPIYVDNIGLGTVPPPFFEGFEEYAEGSDLHHQGGWSGWGLVKVSSAFAYAGAKSVGFGFGGQLVTDFYGYTGGQLELSLRQFVPSSDYVEFYVSLACADGTSGALIQATHNFPLESNLVYSGDASLPLIEDRWVEWRFQIDLDANSVAEYYDEQLLSIHQWSHSGNVAAPLHDLFLDNLAADFYIDNISLATVPAGLPGLRRQVYTNVVGASVAGLTINPKFPQAPDLVDTVLTLESQYLPNDAGEQYGQRLTGWLRPSVTGKYVFYLAADDAAQVFLSTNESPYNKQLILDEPTWTDSRCWARTSPEISLVAGSYYYLEVLHKENTGGDNLAVTWQLPGEAAPTNGAPPIGTYYLVHTSDMPEMVWSVEPSGSGTVSLNPAPPADGRYTNGTVVTLTATPATGYRFSHWSGALSGVTNSATLTVTNGAVAKAHFVAAPASFFEDFEEYAQWSNLHGQGGWAGWDNDPAKGAVVSGSRFLGTNSVEIGFNTDLVHPFPGFIGGLWELSLWQFIDPINVGTTYVVLMNTYNVGGPYAWSVQIRADMVEGRITSDDGRFVPMRRDEWVEYRFQIDLDANKVTDYYAGEPFSTNRWYNPADGKAAARFQALDLFGNFADNVFYDNIALVGLAITEQPKDILIRPGQPATFEVGATAVGLDAPIRYQWQLNGTNILGATDRTHVVPAPTAADNGAVYRCAVQAGSFSRISREAVATWLDTGGAYAKAVLADQPLVYYRFEEAAGATTYDATTNGFNGIYANVVHSTGATAALGKAAKFNGSNSSVAVPVLSHGAARTCSQLTIEAWVNVTTFESPSGFGCVYNHDGWSEGSLHMQVNPGNRWEFSVNGSDPTDLYYGDASSVSINQWYHLAAVYDADARTLLRYANGILVERANYTAAVPIELGGAHLGAWNGDSRYYNGLLDEVAIYDRALSSERIAAHYQAAQDPVSPYLSGLRRQVYTEIAGGGVADLTGNAKYPQAPDVVDTVSALESLYPPDGTGERYGQRLTGWLVPPLTGNYVFYLAADDAAQVFLSTNNSPYNKRLILDEATYTGWRCWAVSNSAILAASNHYYIEVLHKEDTGGDHVAVSWQLPGGIVPTNGAAPIGGTKLVYMTDMPEILWRIEPPGSGSVSLSPPPPADGRYTNGTEVTLTALPGGGYRFTNWSGALSGTANPRALTVTNGAVATAHFVLDLTDVTRPGDAIVATSGNSPGNEGVTNAIDNQTSTKYFNFDKLNTGFTVTPSLGPTVVTGLGLTSANDCPERDPASFRLLGSTNGSTFTVIATNVVPSFSGRFQQQNFFFTNATAFKAYRLIFPTLANATTALGMQISEVQLFGRVEDYAIAATAYPLLAGTVEFKPGSPNGRYTDGTVLSLTARPASGYQFEKWTESEVERSREATYTFTVSATRVLVACFITEKISIAISFSEQSLRLSWDRGATGYVLETTEGLEPPVQWTPVSGVVSNLIVIPAPGSTRFYRLRK